MSRAEPQLRPTPLAAQSGRARPSTPARAEGCTQNCRDEADPGTKAAAVRMKEEPADWPSLPKAAPAAHVWFRVKVQAYSLEERSYKHLGEHLESIPNRNPKIAHIPRALPSGFWKLSVPSEAGPFRPHTSANFATFTFRVMTLFRHEHFARACTTNNLDGYFGR